MTFENRAQLLRRENSHCCLCITINAQHLDPSSRIPTLTATIFVSRPSARKPDDKESASNELRPTVTFRLSHTCDLNKDRYACDHPHRLAGISALWFWLVQCHHVVTGSDAMFDVFYPILFSTGLGCVLPLQKVVFRHVPPTFSVLLLSLSMLFSNAIYLPRINLPFHCCFDQRHNAVSDTLQLISS